MIFPYTRIPEAVRSSIPPDTDYNYNEKGYMQEESFMFFLKHVVYKRMKQRKAVFPIILFVDNHRSHCSLRVHELCKKLDITLICLYPNATFILQPCDVSYFSSLKTAWNEFIRQKQISKLVSSVTCVNFATLFIEFLELSHNPKWVKSGFRTCGLFPWDVENINFDKVQNTDYRRKTQSEKLIVIKIMLQAHRMKRIGNNDQQLSVPQNEMNGFRNDGIDRNQTDTYSDKSPSHVQQENHSLITDVLNERIVIESLYSEAAYYSTDALPFEEVPAEVTIVDDSGVDTSLTSAELTDIIAVEHLQSKCYIRDQSESLVEQEQIQEVQSSSQERQGVATNGEIVTDQTCSLNLVQVTHGPEALEGMHGESKLHASHKSCSKQASYLREANAGQLLQGIKTILGPQYGKFSSASFEPSNFLENAIHQIIHMVKPPEIAEDVLPLPKRNFRKNAKKEVAKAPYLTTGVEFEVYRGKIEREKAQKERDKEALKEKKEKEKLDKIKTKAEQKYANDLNKAKKVLESKLKKVIKEEPK